MKKQDVFDYFGSQSKVAAALKITDGAVSQWGDSPPMLRQYQIQDITNGALKVCDKAEKKNPG